MHKFNKDNPFFTDNKKEITENENNTIYETNIENSEINKISSKSINPLNPYTYEIKNDNNSNDAFNFKYKNLDFIGKDLNLNQEQKDNLRKVLFSNYVKLGKYAKKFEDSFIKNLVETSINKKIDNTSDDFVSKDINNFITKTDLLKYIEENKNDILFEIFYNHDIFKENNKKNSKSLYRFLTCYALSEMGGLWLNFFDPSYSVTDPNKKDFVNQIKALNYLIYNIKNEDYPRAYSCFANIHPNNVLINKIKNNLEIMAKNQIFCDIVENHIDASQYYRERKIYDYYKL